MSSFFTSFGTEAQQPLQCFASSTPACTTVEHWNASNVTDYDDVCARLREMSLCGDLDEAAQAELASMLSAQLNLDDAATTTILPQPSEPLAASRGSPRSDRYRTPETDTELDVQRSDICFPETVPSEVVTSNSASRDTFLIDPSAIISDMPPTIVEEQPVTCTVQDLVALFQERISYIRRLAAEHGRQCGVAFYPMTLVLDKFPGAVKAPDGCDAKYVADMNAINSMFEQVLLEAYMRGYYGYLLDAPMPRQVKPVLADRHTINQKMGNAERLPSSPRSRRRRAEAPAARKPYSGSIVHKGPHEAPYDTKTIQRKTSPRRAAVHQPRPSLSDPVPKRRTSLSEKKKMARSTRLQDPWRQVSDDLGFPLQTCVY